MLLAKMVVACAGYRVKGQGSHQTAFLGLPLAVAAGIAKTAGYLDRSLAAGLRTPQSSRAARKARPAPQPKAARPPQR